MKAVLLNLIVISIVLSAPIAFGADDTGVARALYTKPLTYNELPRGYKEKPRGWSSEPKGFREVPIQWRAEPAGFRETPIQQLLEPRNGVENPPNFTERESIPQANLSPTLQQDKDSQIVANNDQALRLEIIGAENSIIKNVISEKDLGYKGINPPSKVKLQDFQ